MKLGGVLILGALLLGGCVRGPIGTCRDEEKTYLDIPDVQQKVHFGCEMNCCSSEKHHTAMCWCSKDCHCWRQFDPKYKIKPPIPER